MIIFHYVKWKNLLSTGSEWVEIDFLKSPMTMVVGRNGHGKSTMLDAVCFGLFGKAFRNITKSQLINSINNKDMCVEIAFSRGSKTYKIVRGVKPSLFDIYVDGEKLDQDANVRDTQDYLETNILKFSMKAFTQIVILGSATFIPFMQLPAQSRREIVENLLDINVFGEMNSILKERIKVESTELSGLEQEYKSTSKNIEYLREAIRKISSSRAESIEVEQKRLEEAQNKVLETKKKLDSLGERVASLEDVDLTQLESKQHEYAQATSKISGKLQLLREQIDFLENHDDCPTCKQGLEHSFKDNKLKALNEEADQLRSLHGKLKDKLSEIKEQYESGNRIKSGNRLIIREMDSVKDLFDLQVNNVQSIKKNLNRLHEQSKQTADEEQQEVDKQIVIQTQLEESIVAKKQQLADFDVCAKLLKDNGIKTSVVKKYLPLINQKVNEYLAVMDFFVEFELDETFTETIRSRHRDTFSFASFSEGQKQRINLALLFTWREIAKLRNNQSTNLLLMDEVLDGSLEQEATDCLLDSLEKESKVGGTRVVVITHSPDAYRERFDRTIRFAMKDNFSYMVEEN